MARDANRISQIEQVKDLENLVSDDILTNINLYPLSVALQVRESCLSHQPVRDDSACNSHINFLRFELRGGGLAILVYKVRGGFRTAGFIRVRGSPRRPALFPPPPPFFIPGPPPQFQ